MPGFLKIRSGTEYFPTDMDHSNKEEQRALNMVWNGAGDYSFQPKFKAFDRDGKADPYWNCIIGAVRRHYDYPTLDRLFRCFEGNPARPVFESLLWIGLENCAYEKELAGRPALEELRRSCAENTLRDFTFTRQLEDVICTAHFKRVLGLEPGVTGDERTLLDALEFDVSMTTGEITERTLQLFHDYLGFTPPGEAKRSRSAVKAMSLRIPLRQKFMFGQPRRDGDEVSRMSLLSRLSSRWLLLARRKERSIREDMEIGFGLSMYDETQETDIERLLCNGNHRDCRLHFTRGEYPPETNRKGPAEFQRKYALRQGEKNRKYYQEHLTENQSSILRLENRIRNALLTTQPTSVVRADRGILEAGRVWRNLYLNDRHIFRRKIPDEPDDMTVDILLDASASQITRQETIAAQGYMIAESLSRCGIPVRVCSFCSVNSYTVIHLFRDYHDTRKNGDILSYFAAGFNRDGLALRAAFHMMQQSGEKDRILIVLSDSQPNDMHRVPGSGRFPRYRDYSDTAAVRDTAEEVRSIRSSGVSVLCVFTGDNRDLPAAEQIYGRDLARIQSPERFADTVGALIQKLIAFRS